MNRDADLADAAAQLREAAAAKKCWPCGCLHSSIATIERALPEGERPSELDAALRAGRERLAHTKYDCLGCKVCYPALAINAISRIVGEDRLAADACPTETVAERDGWPPLPGDYRVLRYNAPVAICTLTDVDLTEVLAGAPGAEVAIVGTMQTENLGIERLISNVVTNPNIRFLVLCGPDSEQAVGHLPGASLLALSHAGLDERGRIVGAPGKRPVLKNVGRDVVDHFRSVVEVVDLIGITDVATIASSVRVRAARNPGPASSIGPERRIETVSGYVPTCMIPDPEGYFVIYLDRRNRHLALEHYRKEGVLDLVIEGREAAELYIPAIEKRLVSRLDHAAYLGRELARAERALHTNEPFVQDAAPERPPVEPPASCACTDASCEVTR